jgi:20S proteasome alpha/beta subunit
MTYILGSRCRDGVVMIADRKFTVDYGSSYLHDNKLVHEVAGIVVGFSGSRGVFEPFSDSDKKTCYGIRRRDCSRRICFKNI